VSQNTNRRTAQTLGRRIMTLIALTLAACLSLPNPAGAEPCEPQWEAGDCPPGLFGGVGLVRASLVWDDGTGEALYVAGQIFHGVGCASGSGVFKWDGTSWSAVGVLPMFLSDDDVRTLAVFDAGNGPELYAGGRIQVAQNSIVNVVRFDGTDWVPVGEGLAGQSSSSPSVVQKLEVFDDGNGPMLYAVGDFRRSGSNNTFYHVARTDGHEWFPAGLLGTSITNARRSYALHAAEDADGPVLYTMGENGWFARWNGQGWTRIPTSAISSIGTVVSMTTYDRGQGPEVYVASLQEGVRRFNGVNGWEVVAGGSTTAFRWLHVTDLGDGEKLYMCGSSVLAYDGQSVTTLDQFTIGVASLYTLNTYDNGQGPRLLLGGDFRQVNGRDYNALAWWDGQSWSPTSEGPVGGISSFEILDAGQGPELYAAGTFRYLDRNAQNRYIVKRVGEQWVPVGGGLTSPTNALTVHDAGDGPALYAGGNFASRISKWDGSSWTPISTGMNGNVLALLAVQTPDGPRLYAGGEFTNASSQTVNRVAVWDGQSWSPLGAGVSGSVRALIEFDDGTGPAIYAAGGFSFAGGQPVRGIARWDGEQWSPLGPGLGSQGQVNALAVFDDGTGPALYAGGSFNATANQPNASLARWDGQQWSDVAGGVTGGINGGPTTVTALRVIDTGDGPALYVAGTFNNAGGIPVRNLAIYDHNGWRAAPGGPARAANDIVLIEDEVGPALLLGGGFASVIDADGATIPSATLATLRLCPIQTQPCPADLTGPALDGQPDGLVDASDLDFYIARWLSNDPAADLTGPALDNTPDGLVNAFDLNAYVNLWLDTQGVCP